MKSVVLGLSSFAFALVVSTSAKAEEMDKNNNPSSWDSSYTYYLDKLPTSGMLEGSHLPWADSYWPSYKGGIAHRWKLALQEKETNAFKDDLYSHYRLRNLSQAQIDVLSPAEKYDIFMGRYDYPTVKKIRDNLNPHIAYWKGICDGWSVASISFPEPAAVVLKNADGISIPFSSSDVKALMSYAFAYAQTDLTAKFIGTVCKLGGAFRFMRNATSACRDVNPAALHILLANRIGVQKKSFIMDRSNDREVWNQPVIGFESRIVGYERPSEEEAARGVYKIARVDAIVKYIDESPSQDQPLLDKTLEYVVNKDYSYKLELNYSNKIIGGSWDSDYRQNHPDFLWLLEAKEFTGEFAGLKQIYTPAR